MALPKICTSTGCFIVLALLGTAAAGASQASDFDASRPIFPQLLSGAAPRNAQQCGPNFGPAGLRSGDVFQSLHSFASGDGVSPNGLVAVGQQLYGTTAAGGLYGRGTVYETDGTGVEHNVYTFKGGADGAAPQGLVAANGVLYGTTVNGGSNGWGTVFSVTPAGVERVLYSFKGGTDGWTPDSGPTLVNGDLYGTTQFGGANGVGTVYEVTSTGTERLVHSFGLGADGANPQAGLTLVNGTLYGATFCGGANSSGAVFAVAPTGAEHVLYSFKGGVDAENPQTNLVALGNSLYGTTIEGGANGLGAVFRVDLAGGEVVVHSFSGYQDGANPFSSLVAVSGMLYGTTIGGGGVDALGTIFAVDPSGAEQVLYSFKNSTVHGASPQASLIALNGLLYGTTPSGGSHGGGTLFVASTTGSQTVLKSFAADADAESPQAGLAILAGALYGTTYDGGSGPCSGDRTTGCGAVFKLSPNGIERLFYSFKGGADGANPEAGLTPFHGALYGTTVYGGSHSSAGTTLGTVFELSLAGTKRVIYNFTGKNGDGASPDAGVIAGDGGLFGTTTYGGNGGPGGAGTVFEVSTAGAERVLHEFTGAPDGAHPHAGLIDVGGVFYGTTYDGGAYGGNAGGYGTVFAISASGVERVLHSFGSGTDGANPEAALISANGVLYGTTAFGGARGAGTVFSVTASGTERVLYNFRGGSDGAIPRAGLVYANGALYGTTSVGGRSGDGTVFAVSPTGTERLVHSFSGTTDGAAPLAGLILSNGVLYGTTSSGGMSGNGTAFKIAL